MHPGQDGGHSARERPQEIVGAAREEQLFHINVLERLAVSLP